MSEEVKRLQPKQEVLRELFLKSGNLCAFPNCDHLMMNAEGVFIGQVCHIEAASEEGQRFNPSMTNEERRAFSNLMLMCYPHHQETNDVTKYPVARLKQMKEDHERRFSSPGRAMREQFKDWTKADDPQPAQNLKRMHAVLKWAHQTDEQLRGTAKMVNEFAQKLAKVPLVARNFLGAAAVRAYRMIDTGVVRATRMDTRILLLDLQNAFGLPEEQVAELASQLSSYGLGHVEEMDWSEDNRPALVLGDLDGWDFWRELAKFCALANEEMTAFTEELEFSRLDQ